MGKGDPREWRTPQDAQRNEGVERKYDNTLSDQELGYVNPAAPGAGVRSAYDYRHRLPVVNGWSEADLYALPIYQQSCLHAGELYFDLCHPHRGELKAAGEDTVPAGELYVTKRDVRHDLWNRLTDFSEHYPGRGVPNR